MTNLQVEEWIDNNRKRLTGVIRQREEFEDDPNYEWLVIICVIDDKKNPKVTFKIKIRLIYD